MSKKGIIVINSPGTIDSDYRGEVKVTIKNVNKKSYAINDGERFAQIKFCPVPETEIKVTDELPPSDYNKKRGPNSIKS
jgi:dUTP pyrophosphatase